MRRLFIFLTVLVALLAAAPAGAATRHRADGRLGEWKGKPTNLAGQAITSRGEFIYTDWVYDDFGPDLDGLPSQPPFRAALTQVSGDYRYPADEKRYGYNAADLRELRVSSDRKTLRLLISLESMKVADAAFVMVALDGDGRPSTSKPLPDGANVKAAGADRFIETWGNTARVRGARRSYRVKSRVNLRENAIEVDVPYSRLGKLKRFTRMWVLTGLNDKGRFAQQEAGRAAAFNVGFRKESYPHLGGSWNDVEQAKVLAGGDVSDLNGRFDLRRLQKRRSDRRPPIKPGFYTRLFRSKQDYGEGINLKQGSGPVATEVGGNPDPEFLSRWQPYALYIPDGYNPAKPNQLTLVGHSLDSSMNQYRSVSPNFLKQVGDERDSVLITPLARGADTWYIDSGFVDVLEAWDDVRANYKIDEERTSINGYSMGGYMTYRMGLLMPDRFARASVYVGPPAYQHWAYPAPPEPTPYQVEGNTNQIVDNAYNLPYEIIHGNADELVPVTGVQHQADTFAEKGNDYRFYRHAADDHLSFILNDEWGRTRDFLGNNARDRNPTEVVFRRMPVMDMPKHRLIFDGAYWVDGIDVRDKSAGSLANALVRATTYGFGGNRKTAQPQLPQAVPGPVTPGTKSEQRQVAGAPIAKSNGFETQLTNARAVSFDVARMAVDPRRALTMRVETDGPVKIVLLGNFPAISARTLLGELPVAATPGRVEIDVPSGTSDVTVTPR